MKKIIIIFYIVSAYINSANAQIVDVNSGATVMDAPSGTYIKDVFDTFTPFLGTWIYQNGNEILTIKLEKVTQHYYPEYGNYQDFIKGNYSYTTNGGTSYSTNTININSNNNDRDVNSLYTSGPENSQIINMTFRDEIYQKTCYVTFTFLPNSTNQMEMKLINKGGGYILPETPPNPDFSIPNNVVLTKQ